MRKLILSIGMIAFVFGLATAQTDYVQVEVVSLTPKLDKLDLFKKALAAHNKKYHGADPYKIGVYYSVTGPNSGSYLWVMGPTSFTQLDGRPGKGEHDLDWEKNVMPLCQNIGAASYWRLNQEVTYRPEGNPVMPKTRLRFSVVKPGQMERYVEQIQKVVAVYKKKQYKSSFDLWQHYGVTNAHNAVGIMGFANWAGFDQQIDFAKDFEEVHGAGSWARFQQELDICIDRSQTYDELSEYVPELSTNATANQ